MSKGMIGAAGGLSAADKAKLIPENIKAGVTLFAGTPREVAGVLAPLALFAKGQANGDTWGSWLNVNSTTFVSPNNILVGTDGKATITVNESGTYRFYVVFSAAVADNPKDASNSFQLVRNGAAIVSKSSLGDNGVINVDVNLTAGDVLTWQIYVHHAAVIYYNFITVYRIA